MNANELTYTKHAPPRLDVKNKCILYLHTRYGFSSPEEAEAMFQMLLTAHNTGDFDTILRTLKSIKKHRTGSQHDPHSKNKPIPIKEYYENRKKEIEVEKGSKIKVVSTKKTNKRREKKP